MGGTTHTTTQSSSHSMVLGQSAGAHSMKDSSPHRAHKCRHRPVAGQCKLEAAMFQHLIGVATWRKLALQLCKRRYCRARHNVAQRLCTQQTAARIR